LQLSKDRSVYLIHTLRILPKTGFSQKKLKASVAVSDLTF
jgi:hypothetical protein